MLGAGALGRPRGMGWGGGGVPGWGTRVNPWLIHVNAWQRPLQYYKVISLQLIKIIGEKKKKERNACVISVPVFLSMLNPAICLEDFSVPSKPSPSIPWSTGNRNNLLFHFQLRYPQPHLYPVFSPSTIFLELFYLQNHSFKHPHHNFFSFHLTCSTSPCKQNFGLIRPPVHGCTYHGSFFHSTLAESVTLNT